MNSLKKISDYLYSQRWCNFKSEITEHNLRHVTFDILPFDKDKILAVGHAEFAEKDDSYFMMPMKQADENTSDKTLDFEGIAYKDAELNALSVKLEKDGAIEEIKSLKKAIEDLGR